MNLKRFLLFLALFSSGLLILFVFMESEEPVVIPPPPPAPDGANATGPAGPWTDPGPEIASPADGKEPGATPDARPNATPGATPGAAPGAGSTATPSPDDRDGTQANMQDATLTMTETLQKEDGSTEKVLAARIHVHYVTQVRDSNELRADGVSFTFYDKTTAQRPVAEGTADHAVLIAISGGGGSLGDLELGKDLVLKDNVRVKLIGTDEAAGETVLLAPILFLEEQAIRSPLAEDGNDVVTILSDGISIAGRGMDAELEEGTFSFKKDITIEGTGLDMPALFPGSPAADGTAAPADRATAPAGGAPTGGVPETADGTAAPAAEPIRIECGGPFHFTGKRADGEPDGKSRSGDGNPDPGDLAVNNDKYGSMLQSGTLDFDGGVTVTRGGRRLDAQDMTMEISRDGKNALTLSSITAGRKAPGVTIAAAEGTTRSARLEWHTVAAGTITRLLGEPVIEGLSLPSLSGAPEGEGAEDELYDLSAGEEIRFETTDEAPDGKEGAKGAIVRLLGGGSVRRAGTGPEDGPPIVSGDEIFIRLVEKDAPRAPGDAAGEGAGTGTNLRRTLPELIRVTGNASARLEEVVLDAEEITMTLEPTEAGFRRVLTLQDDAILKQGEYVLESREIVIRTVPGIVREAGSEPVDFTEIVAGDGFVLTFSLEEFGRKKTPGGETDEEGTKGKETAEDAGRVTATGGKTVRLSWYDTMRGTGTSEKIQPNLQIFGPHEIIVDLGPEERAMIRAQEMLDMGTSTYDGSMVTILALKGSPHIEMNRGTAEEMRLDCREAWVTLDHTAAQRREEASAEERDTFEPIPASDSRAAFFRNNLVRRIEAIGAVDLAYGTTRVNCESIDWRLPEDRLVADGGGKPVDIRLGMMKLSGSRFLLMPAAEKLEISDPEAFRLPGPGEAVPGEAIPDGEEKKEEESENER